MSHYRWRLRVVIMTSNGLLANEELRVLFREFAGVPAAQRRDHYARRNLPADIRAELESLLGFDDGQALTQIVGSAADHLLAADAEVHEGCRCGPYRMVRLLGHGGMGSVYLAERADGEIEQQVAVKFVRSAASLPAFHERFLRERQILASLNHPGIARLLNAGHAEGRAYLVMEYVDGIRIDEHAATLDLPAVLKLFLQAGEAVAYAHRNLVIHRDLKPSNILVDATGQPKLLDFGIAKILDAPEMTLGSERLLTPEYASPEQHRGEAQATTTDIYSLGAVLTRLIHGLSPGKDLAAILSKSMREEPEERYASVDLFMADIRAYLDHRPVQARRGSTWYSVRKFVRRRWLPMAAGALAVAGLAGGLYLANHERAIAERRFDQVRRLSNQLLQLDNEIRTLPGSTKARKQIVSVSLDYLQRLGSEVRAGQDLELSLEIGKAYLQVAKVQGVPTNSNVGQFAEARRSLSRASSFADAVLVSGGDDSQQRKALLLAAEAAHDAMILADSERRLADFRTLSRKAAGSLEMLLGASNPSREESSTAARLYASLAIAHSNLHLLGEAVRYARRSVEISRQHGNDSRQLVRGLGALANTARFSGDLEGALSAIRESRALAEKLVSPDNSHSVLALAGALWREGLILGELNNINLDRPREAVPLLERAFQLAEELALKDPHDYTSRSYIAMAGRELGDVLRDTNPARALAVYDHALRRNQEIQGNQKADLDRVWMLAGSSYALRRLGRPVEALDRINAARKILERDTMVPVGQELDTTLRALADHLGSTGQTSAAIRAYEELLVKLEASHPQPMSDLRHANGISRLYRDLAGLHRRAGQMAEATRLDQQREELWRHWERELPGNAFVRRQLSSLSQ